MVWNGKIQKTKHKKNGMILGGTPWIRWIGNLQMVSKFKLVIQTNLWSPTRQGKSHCYPLLQDAASRLIGESPFLRFKLNFAEWNSTLTSPHHQLSWLECF
jgi:hypothetical protein